MLRLSAPSFPMWFVSLLFGGAGLAARLGHLPPAAPYAFWLVAIAFVLLLVATLFRSL